MLRVPPTHAQVAVSPYRVRAKEKYQHSKHIEGGNIVTRMARNRSKPFPKALVEVSRADEEGEPVEKTYFTLVMVLWTTRSKPKWHSAMRSHERSSLLGSGGAAHGERREARIGDHPMAVVFTI